MDDSKRAQLIVAYNNSDFFVEGPSGTFLLRLGHIPPSFIDLCAKGNVQNWAIITSDNPFSKQLNDLENEHRRREFERLLVNRRYFYVPAYGQDPQKEWPAEHGFFIANIFREEASSLGRIYGQNAIVYGETTASIEILWLL